MAEPILPIELIETGNLPTVLTSAGLIPTPPLDLLRRLIEIVSRTNPGYTANLPGTLIEDIASTDTQTMVLIDQARVEAMNSLTPYGCNEFVLMLLGKVYGVDIGQPTNTSVFVVFTGLPGFVIGKGFVVGDGTFQYIVQEGAIIGDDGQSLPVYCVSQTAGSWAVPAGTVTALITPPPSGFTLSVINPEPGIPAASAETATQYRTRVLRAGLAASQGMARYLRTLLSNVPGVQDRLVGIQQQPGGGWLIIVGGGDPYEVAFTIYQALFDISELVGSTNHVVSITLASPALVTTDINHGYFPGSNVVLSDSNPVDYDGTFAVVTVPGEKAFTLGTRYPANQIASLTWAAGVVTAIFLLPHGVTAGSTFVLVGTVPAAYNGTFVADTVPNATTITYALAADPGADTVQGQLQAGIANFSTVGFPAYVGSAVATPNARNLTVSITDFPDSYLIQYVVPPQQSVTCTVRWDTNSPNFVSPAAVAQLATPALVAYINSIIVGQPINTLQMADAFQNAIVSILPPMYLSVLTFQIAINGVGTAPLPGTHIVRGDPQSFFFSTDSDFDVGQL